MELFPALLIGGPPHSGKSVLAYSLSQAFRRLGLEHYLLRACPDGEGDWANEIDQSLVRTVRLKGEWTPTWVDRICRDITRRHLPLLVDVGGRPAPWQEPIFNHCTHAVLLNHADITRDVWRAYARRYGLTVLAELASVLDGPEAILADHPVFQARLAGLQRKASPTGPVFEALVNLLQPYFDYVAVDLTRLHLNMAPVQPAIDLNRLARTFDMPFDGQKAVWQPACLPQLLDYLPSGEPLALYGRGPNWLYAALALHCRPAPFYQFDVRLGWVSPPGLKLGLTGPNDPLQAQVVSTPHQTTLNFSIAAAYLDHWEANGLLIPIPPQGKPLALNGKLPLWLFTALVLAYQHAPLLAIYQPQAGHVVVSSQMPGFAPGDLLPPVDNPFR
jgi:CRISPR-associated protein Csx3